MVNLPDYSSGVGLVLYGAGSENAEKKVKSEEINSVVRRVFQVILSLWKKTP